LVRLRKSKESSSPLAKARAGIQINGKRNADDEKERKKKRTSACRSEAGAEFRPGEERLNGRTAVHKKSVEKKSRGEGKVPGLRRPRETERVTYSAERRDERQGGDTRIRQTSRYLKTREKRERMKTGLPQKNCTGKRGTLRGITCVVKGQKNEAVAWVKTGTSQKVAD